MVFNKDLLFIHIGKAGGTSAKNYLRKKLKSPVYFVLPEDLLNGIKYRPGTIVRKLIGKEFLVEGNLHATLEEAIPFLNQQGFDIKDFKLIIAIIRNPIEMELSHYFHLQKEKIRERIIRLGYESGKIKLEASKGNFNDFVKFSDLYHRVGIKVEDYFLVNGKIPENLHLIKLEELEETLPDLIAAFGNNKNIEFPHINKSKRDSDKMNFSDDTINLIKGKYNWLYENGYYQ